MQKYFIITVDTEGDNLWNYKPGNTVTTNNSKYIPRFQELCEKYKFPPVYLSNYEMLCDDEYVSYIKDKHSKGLCEVGLHLHAWNNPPEYELNSIYNGNPYLIEYPDDVMQKKFDYLYTLFCEEMGFKPISHRAGRWAMDSRYFKLLDQYGVKVDCSVTPHIDWSKNKGATQGGTDYRNYRTNCNNIYNIFEIPLTTIISHRPLSNSFKKNLRTCLYGTTLQLRPAVHNFAEMRHVVNQIYLDDSVNYIQMMLHSSELMPNGSPYFPDSNSIDSLYALLQELFDYIQTKQFVGITLKEYYERTKEGRLF